MTTALILIFAHWPGWIEHALRVSSFAIAGNMPIPGQVGMQLSALLGRVRVLIAEDNKSVAGTIAAMLDASHHEVVETVGSGLEAIHAYQRHKPDIVVMDYLMGGLNGLTACRNILAKDPDAKIIIVSGALDPVELSLVRSGACAILQKPITAEELQDVLDTLTSASQTEEGIGEDPANPSHFF